MNDHFRDVRKMIGDTPRMKAAQMTAMEHGTGDVWRVGCDIERELTAANERIKRLVDAGSELMVWIGLDISDSNRRLIEDAWRKAMEAKP